jgi:hypothetical protein
MFRVYDISPGPMLKGKAKGLQTGNQPRRKRVMRLTGLPRAQSGKQRRAKLFAFDACPSYSQLLQCFIEEARFQLALKNLVWVIWIASFS